MAELKTKNTNKNKLFCLDDKICLAKLQRRKKNNTTTQTTIPTATGGTRRTRTTTTVTKNEKGTEGKEQTWRSMCRKNK